MQCFEWIFSLGTGINVHPCKMQFAAQCATLHGFVRSVISHYKRGRESKRELKEQEIKGC